MFPLIVSDLLRKKLWPVQLPPGDAGATPALRTVPQGHTNVIWTG